MNWRWKARLQNTVAALPLSNQLYFLMQRSVGSLRPGLRSPLEWFSAAAQMTHWIEDVGRTAERKTFLEIGTGRTVDLALGLWLCGAGRVTSVDLNRYLSDALVKESLGFVKAHEDEISKALGEKARDSGCQTRLRELINFTGDLEELLDLANVTYDSPADATNLDLADKTVDFHVSYAVLEHMPPEIMKAMLSEARRVLAPGGLLLHVIDPSDHFSHDDDSITAINFLQFSDDEWDRLAGNRFMYHNRLRAYEYVQLFQAAGLKILSDKQVTDEPSLEMLRSGFQLDGRFRDVRVEELAVRNITLIACVNG